MAIEKTINIDVNSKKAQKDVKDLEKSIEGVNKEVKEVSESSSELTGQLDNLTGGAISKFKGFRGTLKNVITSFKSLKVAIIATGIGALLIAVTALGQAFTRSEEGQNKFAKILGVIGSVVGNLLDLLADLGENIISVFENPKQALKDFTNLIKENLINRFEGLLQLIPKLGEAVTLLFDGKFSAAGKVAADAVGKVVLGVDSVTDSVDNAIEKVKEFGTEVAKDAENAAKIADLRAEADRLDRKLIVDRAKADRDRATLLEQSVNKEKFTVQERIAFLQEAADLEEKITNQEIEAAAKRLEAQQAENALGKSRKEDKEAEAQLEANLIQLETAKLTKQKEVTSQIIAFKAEEAAALKAIADQQAAEEKERLDQKAAEDKERKDKEIQEEKDRLEQEKEIEAQRIATRENTFNTAVQLAGAESRLGKAILLAKQLIQAKEFVLDAKAQILKAKKAVADATINAAGAGVEIQGSVAKAANTAPPPLNIPFIVSAIATGASIISAVQSAVGATKSAASAVGGGGGGGPSISTPTAPASQPPSFNIVGATDTNQLADAISGQTQQPVQAFVVANDVTTAQSLENNIVEGATL